MKKFITALVIGLSAVFFVFQQHKHALQLRPPVPPAQKAIGDKSILLPKEFPYSVVRGGVHSANEVRRATDDMVVKLHYAGIDATRLEVTAYKTNAVRYVSYRVSDQIFWTAKPVTIKAGEPVLCDGRNFIRARCGNRVSEHPMQPTRRNEPSEAELDTPVPERNESLTTLFSLTNIFTPGPLVQPFPFDQLSEQAALPIRIGLWSSLGSYMTPPLTQPPFVASVPPGAPPVGWPVAPGVLPPGPVFSPGPVIQPGPVVVSPVVLPIVPPLAPVVPVVVPPVVPPIVPPVTPPVAPVATPVTPPVVQPVITPVTQPVTTPVVPPVTPPVTPPVVPPVTPPVAPPVTPPVAPLVIPPVVPPTVPVVVPPGPPAVPPVGPTIDVPVEPLIAPPITPPTSSPVSLVTPEPNSFVLFGGALVLGVAIAKIKVLRDGRRKH